MKKDNDGKMHEGHRQRLLELALNAGVDNMSEVQVVELFLTYIFPRGDVNPLAHRLLQEYETFTQIVDADVNDLMRIEGINERAAKKNLYVWRNVLLLHFCKDGQKICRKMHW